MARAVAIGMSLLFVVGIRNRGVRRTGRTAIRRGLGRYPGRRRVGTPPGTSSVTVLTLDITGIRLDLLDGLATIPFGNQNFAIQVSEKTGTIQQEPIPDPALSTMRVYEGKVAGNDLSLVTFSITSTWMNGWVDADNYEYWLEPVDPVIPDGRHNA